MRILPINPSANIYTNKPLLKKEHLSTPFKSAAGNAAKIATGTLAGLLLGALTGGLGPILLGGMLGTTGGAFACKSEDTKDSYHDDHSDQYYP